GRSTLLQEFSLYTDDAEATGATTRVEVRVEVDWREHHKLLKLIFPVILSNAKNPRAKRSPARPALPSANITPERPLLSSTSRR
ncbi:MAG: hypothetical protein M3N68_02375, partial [Actinomycetota bacterium]|nr:hypothetical protein [Actinomycetota bacterium]